MAQGISQEKVAKIVGIGTGTVSRISRGGDIPIRLTPSRVEHETSEFIGDRWNLTIPRSHVGTLEELIAERKIDLGLWTVERHKIKQWEMGSKDAEGNPVVTPLWAVSATLVKNKVIAFARAEIELLKTEALKYSPKFTGYKPRKPAGSGVAVEHSIVDHHFGGLIWGEETGGEDWDSKIATECWKDAAASLMQRTDSYKPELAILLFGNDQQNADNRQGSTERLTPQQMDGRYQKVFLTSVDASRWMIDQAVERYGRVHVVISPGNHDPLASWHLGHSLEIWYHHLKCVTIDNRPQHRKWWEWGTNMVMFEHGDKGKLEKYGKVMASQMSEMWGRTKVHEAHTGHIHHKQVIEDIGFTVRSLPSLRPACSWGSENHHLGAIRAAESFVWSKEEGLIGQANYSVLRKAERAA